MNNYCGFIEVWNCTSDSYGTEMTGILSGNMFFQSLQSTLIKPCFYTVAIFKIKLKPINQ